MYICFIVITILGFTLLWSLRLTLAYPNPPRDSGFVVGLSIVAWLLISVGLIAISGPLFIPCIVALLVVVGKYRESERRALLWTLAVAAEKEIPLGQAAKSFASDRIDEIGRRAQNLGEMIDAGVPLPSALAKAKTPLPTDADLAVRVGYPTQTLHQTLKDAAKYGDKNIEAEQAMFDSILHFLFTFAMMTSIFTFVCIQCVPTFVDIFEDFDMELPRITQLFMSMSLLVGRFWFLLVPIVIPFVGLACYMTLRSIGFRLPELPVVGRFLGNRNLPIILRSLKTSITENQPINKTLASLARHYPDYNARRRLQNSLTNTNDGVHWCDALRKNGIVSATESAVLKSAERVGNLPWALGEMADRHANRVSQRASLISTVLSPILMLIVAIPIGFFAIAIIVPLVNLIQSLATA